MVLRYKKRLLAWAKGSTRGPATMRGWGKVATEKSALEVHVVACLDSQALGYAWACRPVERADAKI
jgi:hypothetical protein